MGIDNNAIVFVGFDPEELKESEKAVLQEHNIDLGCDEVIDDEEDYFFDRKLDRHEKNGMRDYGYVFGKMIADSGSYGSIGFDIDEFINEITKAKKSVMDITGLEPMIIIFECQW